MSINTKTLVDGRYNQVNEYQSRPNKNVIENIYKGDKKITTEYIGGKKQQECVFEDLNHDGHFANDEIIKITNFSYNEDGSHTESIHLDSNRDGYSDEQLSVEYDKNGDLLKTTLVKLKDITKEVGAFLYNRSMLAIKSGLMQM